MSNNLNTEYKLDKNNFNIGSILRWDIDKYNKFINHSLLSHIYRVEFLDSFFGFIEYLQDFDEKTQLQIIENPTENNINQNFGIYYEIFETFLQIYGNKKDKKDRFQNYLNIINVYKKTFLQKLKNEILNILKPKYIFDTFQKNIQKCWIWFEWILEIIWEEIWYDAILGKSKLTINTINWLLQDNDISEDKNIMINNIYEKTIKVFLLDNIYICQNYNNKIEHEENENFIESNIFIEYDEIINKLKLQKKPVCLQLYSWSRIMSPILNESDFDQIYNTVIGIISLCFNSQYFVYSNKYPLIKWIVNPIKHEFESLDWEKIWLLDFINIKVQTFLENNEDNIYYKEENLSDDDCKDILHEVRIQLPTYYQLDWYLSIDEEIKLPIIILSLNLYENIFDGDNNWIWYKKNLMPILSKQWFTINCQNQSDYIIDFVNFLKSLCTDWDILKSLWMT